VTESTKANNNGTETTTVTASLCTASPCVDLVAGGILDTPDPVASGGSLTRIATVSNAGDTSTAVHGAGTAKVWVLIDSTNETLGSFSATAGFTCTSDAISLAPLIIIECTGDLGAGQGVAVTVNSTVTASAGTTLFATVLADPLDEFPEGTGADSEFTNANNDATEATSVVAP
jgi:hypothetical protein